MYKPVDLSWYDERAAAQDNESEMGVTRVLGLRSNNQSLLIHPSLLELECPATQGDVGSRLAAAL